MSLKITSLDTQIKQINNIISVVEKVPYNFDINNLDKIDTNDSKILFDFLTKTKIIKNNIRKLKNTNELLLLINDNLKKYLSTINNLTNKYDNIITNYLLILLITITISVAIIDKINNSLEKLNLVKNIINKEEYLEYLKNIKLINIDYTKIDNKFLILNKFYLEVILKDDKIIYRITNKNNNIIKEIEFNFNDKQILIDDIKYDIILS
jgi:hypothetical protein